MGRTILIVDDTRELREAIAAMLRAKGYSTLCAADGDAALDLIRQHQPDLILLDLVMNAMHGLTLIDILRHNVQQARIPIIIFSEGQDAFLEPADTLCPCEIMPKSDFSLPTLLETIRRLLAPPLPRQAVA
jgi:CheY-like chemotaxis protein